MKVGFSECVLSLLWRNGATRWALACCPDQLKRTLCLSVDILEHWHRLCNVNASRSRHGRANFQTCLNQIMFCSIFLSSANSRIFVPLGKWGLRMLNIMECEVSILHLDAVGCLLPCYAKWMSSIKEVLYMATLVLQSRAPGCLFFRRAPIESLGTSRHSLLHRAVPACFKDFFILRCSRTKAWNSEFSSQAQ